jgi:alkane 1-monooxygenase
MSKWLEIYLHAVPRLYVLGWFVTLVWAIWLLATVRMSALGYFGFAMGLWIICSLNTAIAHELIHTRTANDRSLGVLMDATVGYFHFAEEHLSHHARSGHAIDGDAAIPGESIYQYAWMRYWRSHRNASEYEASRLRRLGKKWWSNRLLHKSSITLFVALCFYYFAGWIGLAIYGFEIVGTAFTIQGITYLQHWGLSERDTPELGDFGYSWDDGCWMQACVTLNHAFHAQHHMKIGLPYYKLTGIQGGLTLPAGYPIMFLVALVPRLFNRIMSCRLTTWLDNVELRDSLENQANCIGSGVLARSIARKPSKDRFRSSLESLQ